MTQEGLCGFITARGIVTEAWAPIAQEVGLTDPTTLTIAERSVAGGLSAWKSRDASDSKEPAYHRHAW